MQFKVDCNALCDFVPRCCIIITNSSMVEIKILQQGWVSIVLDNVQPPLFIIFNSCFWGGLIWGFWMLEVDSIVIWILSILFIDCFPETFSLNSSSVFVRSQTLRIPWCNDWYYKLWIIHIPQEEFIAVLYWDLKLETSLLCSKCWAKISLLQFKLNISLFIGWQCNSRKKSTQL